MGLIAVQSKLVQIDCRLSFIGLEFSRAVLSLFGIAPKSNQKGLACPMLPCAKLTRPSLDRRPARLDGTVYN